MKNEATGICRLCHRERKLTFEHIPPRSAFNKQTRYQSVSFVDAMQMKDPLNGSLKGRTLQGGVGFQSYCSECNNFLGLKYVNPYKAWAQLGAYLLSDPEATACHIKIDKMLPNEILKQIISMFIAINDPWYGEKFPELLDFVKSPESTTLDSKFRIFTYLKRPGQIRYLPYLFKGSFSGQAQVLSEIAFKPFGYIMTYDGQRPDPKLVELTDFKNAIPEEETWFEMNINIFNTHLPVPMDFREREQIEKDIKNSS